MPHIVIVDDRVTNRRILCELAATLESGAEIHSFENPAQVLDWLKNNNTPDLVITDYKMPHMDAAEFIRRFRHLPGCFDIPVMVITVYEDREYRYKALEAGATDFLLSPVDHHEFRVRSLNLLALRRQQQIIKNRAYSLEQKLAQDHRQMEAALQESQDRLRSVIDAVPAMIYACDADQRFVFVNSCAADFAGQPPESLIGQRPRDVFGCGFGETSEALDLKVFNIRKTLSAYEKTLVDSEAKERVMLTTKRPLLSAHGMVQLVVTAALDITARKEAEIALINAKDQAEAANRAKSDFLANMSHELRTPLNAIIGFAEVMSNETLGPIGSPRYQQYASDISGSGTHLLGIINDLLDLSKIEAGRMALDESDVDIRAVLEQVRQLVQERAEAAGLSFTIDAPAGLPLLRADATKVKQVLLNVIGNAVKFTPDGGHVSIDVSLTPERSLRLEVSDSGIGMTENEINVAVSRFGQVQGRMTRSHEGAGLGLPLAVSLVELHEGMLTIHSRPGEGTVIVIEFPRERLLLTDASVGHG